MKPCYIIARGGRAEYLGVLRVTGGKIEKSYSYHRLPEFDGVEKWYEVPADQVVFDPNERYETKDEAAAVFVKALIGGYAG